MEIVDRLENSFTYHAPTGSQPIRYATLRSKAQELAKLIIESTPTSREQSLAITKLEETIMWANKAIACNEEPTPTNGEASQTRS